MNLSAILLVGGHSRRMGRDKAALLIAGEPLWQRQLRILRELPLETVRVSAQAAPAWCPQGNEVVLDADPARGPLSGVAAGLRRSETSHLLVMAVDLPRMTGEHLRKLWSRAQPGIGVIPQQGDDFEPLCAIYPIEAADTAAAALHSPDASLQHFVRTLQRQNRALVYKLTPAEQALYLNMNTPADVPMDERAGSP